MLKDRYEIRNFITDVSENGQWKIKRNNTYLKQYQPTHNELQNDSIEETFDKKNHIFINFFFVFLYQNNCITQTRNY